MEDSVQNQIAGLSHSYSSTRRNALEKLVKLVLSPPATNEGGSAVPIKRIVKSISLSLFDQQVCDKNWSMELRKALSSFSEVSADFDIRAFVLSCLVDKVRSFAVPSTTASQRLSPLSPKCAEYIIEFIIASARSYTKSSTATVEAVDAYVLSSLKALLTFVDAIGARLTSKSTSAIREWVASMPPSHLQLAIATFTADDTPALMGLDILLPCLLRAGGDASTASELLTSSILPKVSELYIKRVLGSKAPLQDSVLCGFAHFFGSLTSADWTEDTDKLQASVLRFVKRSPESAARTVAYLTTQMAHRATTTTETATPDTSFFLSSAAGAGGMAAVCARLLRAPDETVRGYGAVIATQALRLCKDPEVFKTTVSSFAEALTLKTGPNALTLSGQKIAFLRVLRQVALSCKASIPAALATQVVAYLLTAMDKESTVASVEAASSGPDAAYAGVHALPLAISETAAQWLQLAASSLGIAGTDMSALAQITTAIKTGIASKNAFVQTSYFVVLGLASTHDFYADAAVTTASCFLALVADMIGMLKEAVKKSQVLQVPAIVSARVLIAIASSTASSSAQQTVIDALTGAKLWSLFTSASSVLYSSAVCNALKYQRNNSSSSYCLIEDLSESGVVMPAHYHRCKISSSGALSSFPLLHLMLSRCVIESALSVTCDDSLRSAAASQSPKDALVTFISNSTDIASEDFFATIAEAFLAANSYGFEGVRLSSPSIRSSCLAAFMSALISTIGRQISTAAAVVEQKRQEARALTKTMAPNGSAVPSALAATPTQAQASTDLSDLASPTGLPARQYTPKLLKLTRPKGVLVSSLLYAFRIISSAAQPGAAPLGNTLFQVLLLIAHPYISGPAYWVDPSRVSERATLALWARLSSIIRAAGLSFSDLVIDVQAAGSLLTNQMLSNSPASRNTAVMTTYLLLESDRCEGSAWISNALSEVSMVAINGILEALNQDSIASLYRFSEFEVGSYLFPELTIASSMDVVDGLNVDDIKLTNADRKKSGGKRKGAAFGTDAAFEDELWAEQVRKEKAKKLLEAKGISAAEGNASSALLEKKRAEVLAAQAKVAAVVDIIARSLDALSSVTAYLTQLKRRLVSSLSGITLVNKIDALVVRSASKLFVSRTMESTLFGAFQAPLAQLLCCRLTEPIAEKTLAAYCAFATLPVDALTSMRFGDLKITLQAVCRAIYTGVNRPTIAMSGAAATDYDDNLAACKLSASGSVDRLTQALFTIAQHGLAAGQKHNKFNSSTSAYIINTTSMFVILSSLLSPCMPDGVVAVIDWMWPDAELAVFRPLLAPVVEASLIALKKFRFDVSIEGFIVRLCTQHTLDSGEIGLLLGSLGLLSADAGARSAALRIISSILRCGCEPTPSSAPFESRLWLCVNDSDEGVRSIASSVWSIFKPSISTSLVIPELFSLFSHETKGVRESAARAVATCVKNRGHDVSLASNDLIALFDSNLPLRDTPSDKTVGKSAVGKGVEPLAKKGPTLSMADAFKLTGKAERLEDPPHKIRVREAVAVAVTAFGLEADGSSGAQSTAVTASEGVVGAIFDFILQRGVTDTDANVKALMLSAGRAMVDAYGPLYSGLILARLDAILTATGTSKASKEDDVTAADARRLAAVILLGAAGKHLVKTDSPSVVTNIVETLITALDTPAESVQRSVADCLWPLVQAVKTSSPDFVGALVPRLMSRCQEGPNFAARRGAAFGLAAVVKGLGVACLKQFDVIQQLKDASSAGSVDAREGSLCAFELLSDRLGLLFEPYVISLIPILLKSFSHSSNHVREAAQAAAGVIMGKLSAHGVKQVLTPILASLPEETQWKSRQEALRLLGSMAHCAPKQLSACLPQIIPRLVEAGSDPHPKVKESAREAMADISSVIRNPEVAQLTPVLLAALGDPANKTKEALEALMNCEFMHSIDAPSLALLVPILGRALRDRGADLKRKSAVITGNMCTMISDQSVLVPYLPQVVPDLKEALIDPIPDVRTVAAKALGSLIGGVGEAELADLIPWLLSTLQSNISSVERSGAAQGLAEVSNTLGAAKLHAILSEVLPWKNSKSSSAREGLMWLLSFLPAIQSSAFVSEIPNTLPVTLVGLGDTSESVREVALRSAQVLVATQGKQQFQLIIPSLIHGMSDPEWRLRQNSVILLGDLLYLIADTKAVGLNDAAMDDEDDGGMGGSNSRVLVTIRAIVGDEQTNLILASLYIARSDVGSTVRQVALQVWKSVVSNTPRTLIDIMPVLVDIVIKKLSAADDEERTVAARCLGEIVRKLGDRVLPVVIPYLRKGLTSDSISVRRGVCVGLSEILAASTSHQIEMYLDTLVPALQEALCDASSADVRSQGAVAFQTLFKTVGKPALDFVVPSLMTKIEATLFIFGEATEEAEITNGALLGMRELVAAKPRDVVEHLLPRLLATPLTVVNARVLGFISPSASGQLNYYYHDVVTQLIKELIASETRDIADNNRIADLAEVKRCAGCVMGATSDAGIQSLVIELGKQIDKPSGVNGPIDIKIRRWACWLISQLFEKCKIDFSDFMQIILKQLLSHSADSDREVLEAIVQALSAISAAVPLEELTHCNDFIVSCVQSTASDAKHRASGSGLISATDGSKDLWLPLFTLPKSLDPFVAVFIHALLNGSPQQREVAAQALGEFAQFADPAVLKPHLIKITGPLVRIVGDRVPSPVKFAILQTLCVLLRKGSAMLKAFVPQLQTTFVKALVDPSRQVRNQGAHALGQLMALSARIDPLMNELAGLVSNAEAAPLKVSALDAVSVVLQKGGDKVTAPVLSKLTSIIATASADSDESVRRAAAPCAGNFTRWAPSELVVELAEDVVSKPFPTGVISADATVFRNNTGGVSGAASVAAHILGNACSAVTVTAGIPSVTSTVCKCPSVVDDLTELVSVGLQCAEAEGTVRIAVQTACMKMFEDLPTGASIEDAVVDKLVPQLLSNVSDTTNYEIRRTAVCAVKQAAKFHNAACQSRAVAIASALVPTAQDLSMRVKRAGERALKHLFRIKRGEPKSDLINALTASGACNAEFSRNLKEISRKFLSVLPEESEDEDPSAGGMIADAW